MYQSYEFTFAGKSSRMFGLMVCDVAGKNHGDHPFGNQANIVETRLPGRVKPIHYGVRYHDEPLSFDLIFGAERRLDRYEMQEIARWLTGHQNYQWLTLEQPDLGNVRFRCLVQSLKPVSVGWFPVAFEARVVCDCPYAYGWQQRRRVSLTESGVSLLVMNDGTAWESARPKLTIQKASGCTQLSVKNLADGSEMKFTDLPAGELTFTVDCDTRIITDVSGEYDLYNCFNFQWSELRLQTVNERGNPLDIFYGWEESGMRTTGTVIEREPYTDCGGESMGSNDAQTVRGLTVESYFQGEGGRSIEAVVAEYIICLSRSEDLIDGGPSVMYTGNRHDTAAV